MSRAKEKDQQKWGSVAMLSSIKSDEIIMKAIMNAKNILNVSFRSFLVKDLRENKSQMLKISIRFFYPKYFLKNLIINSHKSLPTISLNSINIESRLNSMESLTDVSILSR